jgi:hypothetical protein
MRVWILCLPWLLCLPMGAAAIDSLVVGSGGRGLPWEDVVETTVFMGVEADSVWTWPVRRGDDVAALALGRGGRIGVGQIIIGFSGPQLVLADAPGLERWIDADAETAWGPDENQEIGRGVDVYVDLGGSFWIDRVRLAPRLDSEHRSLILGSFRLSTHPGGLEADILALDYKTVASFSETFPNREPVIELRFSPRLVRYLRLSSEENEAWELADFQVFAAGGVAAAELVSRPLFVRGAFPVWGRVFGDGTGVEDLSLRLQTRTGPDDEPLHYFIVIGDELERVSQDEYRRVGLQRPELGSIVIEPGPIVPNPEWSPWQTVSDGLVLSPGPRRYMQFRLGMSEPGTRLRRLTLEYISQPIVDEVQAEISPLQVAPGEETVFTLSMEVHLDVERGDTGLRFIEVLTPAAISGVDSVWVDDLPVVFSAKPLAGGGFSVDLWRRVLQEGSFVQVRFRARVFRDGTQFLVRALDLRAEAGGLESVYQSAREGDVDPLSLGGQLTVRLEAGRQPVVDLVRPLNDVFTPNGDGINDVFEVEFNLLKLVRAAPVRLEVFALDGAAVFSGEVLPESSGAFTRIWDGRGAGGAVAPPGIYLFRVWAETDGGAETAIGVVRLAY